MVYLLLDQLILATAIPKITEAFNSLTELSWLASGFLYVHHLLLLQMLTI
jgi:hypothetical protein